MIGISIVAQGTAIKYCGKNQLLPPPYHDRLLLSDSSAQDVSVLYADGTVNYAVKVKDVRISPDPVVPRKPTTFDICASSGQALPKEKVAIKVLYHRILLRTETHDICEEMCWPIASGYFTLSHSQNLPALCAPGDSQNSIISRSLDFICTRQLIQTVD
ncbi:hypothetical protein MLD38_025342 [Melastoma candidum]|uniref:Uncharacterized protein n=1 Tax=Melastoma candidum TaxID=119954 RepID=A0ACB9NV13_9MYRT|nr:hypothetical protein MLD38_025342 [Melastoma candidum]